MSTELDFDTYNTALILAAIQRANPTDELTRLRAELKTTIANCIAANKGAERNAWINTSLAKEVADLRAEVERLTRERDEAKGLLSQIAAKYDRESPMIRPPIASAYDYARRVVDERDSLRAQLATISAERDENLKMWQHWQTEAVKAQGDLSRASKAAQTYHNAFDEAVRQRDGNREECRVMAADCLKLTAAAVVKDEALRDAAWLCQSLQLVEAREVNEKIRAALSPTSSPLLADLKAVVEILEQIAHAPDDCQRRAEDALARLARWLPPASPSA